MPTAPSMCALGWVKCREQNVTAGYLLHNYVCDQKNKKKRNPNRFFFFTKPIPDYGKMLISGKISVNRYIGRSLDFML